MWIIEKPQLFDMLFVQGHRFSKLCLLDAGLTVVIWLIQLIVCIMANLIQRSPTNITLPRFGINNNTFAISQILQYLFLFYNF